MARTSLPDEAQPQSQSQSQSQTAETTQAAQSQSQSLSLSLPGLAVIMRIITSVFLILTVSLLASNSTTVRAYDTTTTFHFNDIYAYRYALSTAVIGLAYNLLHLLYSLHQITSGKLHTKAPKLLLYQFLGDKVVMALVATGVGAAFGATVDLKTKMDQMEDAFELYLDTTIFAPIVSKLDDFFNRAYFPSIFLLIAFLTSGVSSLLSSFSLINNNT